MCNGCLSFGKFSDNVATGIIDCIIRNYYVRMLEYRTRSEVTEVDDAR